MPVNVTHMEPHIYRAEWHGAVHIEDVIVKMQELSAMASQNGDHTYVLLVDLTTVTKIPFDIQNLRKTADSDTRVGCYVIVQAPAVGQLLGRMLDKVSASSFVFANSLDEGIELAHEYLLENREYFAN